MSDNWNDENVQVVPELKDLFADITLRPRQADALDSLIRLAGVMFDGDPHFDDAKQEVHEFGGSGAPCMVCDSLEDLHALVVAQRSAR